MRRPGVTEEKGLIAWFAANHVAANLLMILIIVGGLFTVGSIRKETNPQIELNLIQVRVAYLGAAPQEVEEGVVLKVEEAIQNLVGIKKIRSYAFEGAGQVTIEVFPDADLNQLLADVKTRVDAISTFPALTENPVIYKQEMSRPVIMIALHGNLDDFGRKSLGNQIRDDLLRMPEVNNVIYHGDRAYEISVEVSEQTLREYGLTMSEVSQAIRNSAVDMPGGTIKSEGGDIRLRTKGQQYTGQGFADVVLRTFADGTRLTLGDIATITYLRDGETRIARSTAKRWSSRWASIPSPPPSFPTSPTIFTCSSRSASPAPWSPRPSTSPTRPRCVTGVTPSPSSRSPGRSRSASIRCRTARPIPSVRRSSRWRPGVLA